MKKDTANPTIRILVLGSPGVGKNCLESRFTTTTYPPPYDPALTLNSRRYFTLHPHLDIPPTSVTRPLATSHGLSPMGEAHHLRSRPRSAGGSSTCSNPASEVRPEAQDNADPDSLSSAQLEGQRPCVTCLREADTYLVEVINYPALQSAKVRSQVLSKGEYDAVMLVYDVGNRNTFEIAMDLHGEIPLGKRWRRASHSNAGDKTRRGFFGGSSGSDKGNVHGGGETVVALVGNKADFDAEYASVELGLDGPLSDKMAVLEEVDVEERSLVHPLFRESRIYDELSFPPQSPLSARSPIAQSFHGRGTSRHDVSLDVRRSVLSADQILDNRRSVLSLQRSVRTVPPRLDKPPRSFPARDREDKLRIVEKWLDIRRPTIDSGRRGSREEEEPCTRVDSANTESTTVAKRQVSRLEGEMLSRTLLLQVPFFETSAKTGENVEEAFAAIVQGVLREMGLDTTNQIESGTLQARCERKHGRQRQHGRQEGPQPAQEATAAQLETTKVTAESDTAAVEDVETHEELGNGQIPAQRRVRRESMIHRVKKVFMKKPPVMMADIAAC